MVLAVADLLPQGVVGQAVLQEGATISGCAILHITSTPLPCGLEQQSLAGFWQFRIKTR